MQVRWTIVNHFFIEHWMLPHFSHRYPSATEYVEGTNMDKNGTRGSDIEILTLAHNIMLNTGMYTTQAITVGIGMDPMLLIGHLVPV